MRRPNLVAMNAFRRVVEQHSFQAAARSLDLTGGAVSKLVTQLERDIGVRLLHRTTRSVSVSAAGAAFYEAAVRILDDVDAAADAVHADTATPKGRLRVSVPTSFALTWLAPRLPRFIEAWPQLELDLALNDRFVDIVQEGFDCAVRIASALPDSTLVARPLGEMRRLLVAAPRYLEQAPPLVEPADLAAHACLLYTQTATPDEWPASPATAGKPIRVQGIFRVNNSVMLREVLLAGLGIALVPEPVVRDLVDDGRLRVLLPEFEPPPLLVHGIVAHQRYVPHKVRVFLDFMAGEMAAAGKAHFG